MRKIIINMRNMVIKIRNRVTKMRKKPPSEPHSDEVNEMRNVLKELSRKEKHKEDAESVRRFYSLAEEEAKEEEREVGSEKELIKQLSKDMLKDVDVTKVLAFKMLSKDLIEKGEELARLYSDAASAFMNLSKEEDERFAEMTALNALMAKNESKNKVLKQLKELGF